MSDVGASLELDIRSALAQVDALERRLDEATQVTLRADASLITSAIDAAIASAAASVAVEADASDVTSSIDAALDAADETVEVEPDASRLTSAIDSAIDAADTDVDVTADASGVTGAVDSALDASDTTVEADADASGVTGAIDSAVDAADSTVEIDGTATGVTGAIDAAIDAADTSVNVDVDPSGLQSSARAADTLNSALIASTSSGVELRSILQLGGAGAAAAGLWQLVDAASELEQAVGGTTAIFGDAEGRVVGFARSAAEAAGLTETSARQLTSQLGGLLQGFGFTQDQAAELSITLSQLGADLAATFGGTSQEAVEALGAALRGETDPIERYGISLNAAMVESRALEDGLAATKGEIDANAKATSALSIIMDQASNAQGQFAREAETTAGQIERARAEVGNMAAEVGATLQPTVNELVATARADLIPALGELGSTALPAVGDAALAVAPAFGAATDLLIAATPAISMLVGLLDLIPDPLIAAAGAYFVLRRAAGPANAVLDVTSRALGGMLVPTNAIAGAMNTAGGSTNTFRQGLGGLVSSINPVAVALGAGALAFTLWATEQEKARAVQREHDREVTQFAASLAASNNAVDGYVETLSQMVEAGDDVVVSIGNLRGELDLAELLGDAGVTVDQLANAVRRGDREIGRLLDTIEGGSDNETVKLRNALQSVAETMQESAQQSIEAGVALDEFDERAAQAAITANTTADGTVNYARAFDQLKEAERAAAEEAEAAAEQQNALAAAVGGVDAEGQSVAITGLGTAMAHMRDGIGSVPDDFVRFALAADRAGLSGGELEAVAAELGVNADDLASGIDAAAGAVNDFASAAHGGVPSLQDLAGDVDDFTTVGFRDELQKAYDNAVNFQQNLRDLAAERPGVAYAAAILGPDFAATLAEDARAGNDAVLDEIALLIPGLQQQGIDIQSLYQDELGPEWVATLSALGIDMNGALDDSFNPVEVVTPSIASVEGALLEAEPDIGAAMHDIGTGATGAFEDAFNPDAGAAIHAVDAQVEANQPSFFSRMFTFAEGGDQGFWAGFSPDPTGGLDRAAGTVTGRQGTWFSQLNIFGQSGGSGFQAGFRLDPSSALLSAGRAVTGHMSTWFSQLNIFGGSGRSGFNAGISPMSADASGEVQATVAAIRNSGGGAHSAGYGIGLSVGQGFNSGLAAMARSIAATGASLVASAMAAMRAEARIASPSRRFAEEVGRPIGEGVAEGIAAATGDIEASATAAVDAAIHAAEAAAAASPAVAVDPVAIAQATRAGGSGLGTFVSMAAGAVVINASGGASSAANVAAGQQAARGFTTELARQQVRTTARLAGTRS